MRPRIVLDTNVLVAGLRSSTGASAVILDLIFDNLFDLHLSVPLMFQYRDVLARHRSSLRLSPAEVDSFLLGVDTIAFHHDIFFLWRHVLPDAGDASILELAIAANASHLVTHNMRHFRECREFGIEPIPPLQFLQSLGDIL